MSHQKLVEETLKFLNVSTYRQSPDTPVELVESVDVVDKRMTDVINHLGSMFGSHSKSVDTPQPINESYVKALDRYKQVPLNESKQIQIGDTVQTIMQGQQLGTVEKIETKNGITKVYHRHESGNLYASSPSNLKIVKSINESMHKSPDKIKSAQTHKVNENFSSDDICDSKLDDTVNFILEQINVQSLSQLDESMQAEVLSIASDLAPHL
jgi:hypothetical protein